MQADEQPGFVCELCHAEINKQLQGKIVTQKHLTREEEDKLVMLICKILAAIF